MEQTWVMQREHMRWLQVDFRDFVEKRGVPVKIIRGSRMEAVFEDGVRLLGVTYHLVRMGRLRGLNIAKHV